MRVNFFTCMFTGCISQVATTRFQVAINVLQEAMYGICLIFCVSNHLYRITALLARFLNPLAFGHSKFPITHGLACLLPMTVKESLCLWTKRTGGRKAEYDEIKAMGPACASMLALFTLLNRQESRGSIPVFITLEEKVEGLEHVPNTAWRQWC